jgi:hypothetical protein
VTISAENVATHPNPVWRDRADYIVMADLSPEMPDRYEQLWARRVRPGVFELCCLPFFLYGAALGDEFIVREVDGDVILDRVTRRSGHDVLRVGLRRHAVSEHEELHRAIAQSGLPHEWHASGYVAVDIAGGDVPSDLAGTVERLSAGGLVEYEWVHRR